MKYRTPGPWGASEDADLNAEDVDQNFWEHEQRLEGIETNPPQAVSIEDITVEGNMMTIHLSNGQEEGPFALPLARIRYTGEYVPGATMLVGDLFTHNQSIYTVLQEHVAPPEFDPELASVDGPVYDLVIPKPVTPYDIAFYYAALIPGDGQVLLVHVATREFTIPVAFQGSKAFLRIATQNMNLSLPLYKNAELVATIEFTVGTDLEPGGPGQFGIFMPVLSPPGYTFLVPGDRLLIEAPVEFDSMARGLAVNVAGQVEQAG